MHKETHTETALFANGCFWCTEAVFQRLEGVIQVLSGYCGGHTQNPTYKEVCSGNTGHAECLKIAYDPNVISYHELLEVFWSTHDPTSLNRQGNDVGSQYRSAIFYLNDEQQAMAEKSKNEIVKSGIFERPIVTTIEPFTHFFPAEKEHYDYYNRNPSQPYCYFTIKPKVDKLKKIFSQKLKPSSPK